VEKSGKAIDIQIDGGVTEENVEIIKQAGANVIVAGSTVFKAQDRAEIIKKLRG
jgi:ribulose-phosphate 3-epimerase